VKQHSVTARVTWLNDLAEARAAEELKRKDQAPKGIQCRRFTKLKKGQTPLSKATNNELRQLQDRERLRTTSRRVTAVLGSHRSAGVMISAPDTNNESGPWKECTSQVKIEAGCRWENQRRFSQTNCTPPMIQPLRTQLGFLSISSDAKDVLEGNFQARAGIDPYAARLLEKLKKTPIPKTEDRFRSVSLQIPIYKVEKAKERTSAGISLFNFSHYKAMVQNQSIADFEALMASIPQCSGYAYKRWRKGVDVMIPKKVDSIRADESYARLFYLNQISISPTRTSVAKPLVALSLFLTALLKSKKAVAIIFEQLNWSSIRS
jgi:hypothetical protein